MDLKVGQIPGVFCDRAAKLDPVIDLHSARQKRQDKKIPHNPYALTGPKRATDSRC